MKAKSPQVVALYAFRYAIRECSNSGKEIAVPRRKRAVLATNGKIHLENIWLEDDVFAEIRSVFSDAMENDTH